MKLKIDYYIKNKCGDPNFSIHHMIITDDDIKELVKKRIKDNPPFVLYDKNKIISSIDINEVII